MQSVKGYFAKRVREARESMGLSQSELANLAGTSLTTISSIEKGETPTNLDLLEKICGALKRSPSSMVSPVEITPMEALAVLQGAMTDRSFDSPIKRRIFAILSTKDDSELTSRLAQLEAEIVTTPKVQQKKKAK